MCIKIKKNAINSYLGTEKIYFDKIYFKYYFEICLKVHYMLLCMFLRVYSLL